MFDTLNVELLSEHIVAVLTVINALTALRADEYCGRLGSIGTARVMRECHANVTHFSTSKSCQKILDFYEIMDYNYFVKTYVRHQGYEKSNRFSPLQANTIALFHTSSTTM